MWLKSLANEFLRFDLLFILIFVLISGCVAPEKPAAPEITAIPTLTPSPVNSSTPVNTPIVPSITVSTIDSKINTSENKSIAVEVDYRKYVDWFMNHNLNIRAYTPQEYVCGQYTVDMMNASEKAGFHSYFGVVRFSDGTGHALVSFKSTFSGFTSWYFFEPQTNNLITPEILANVLKENMGLTVTEVTVYGYYDDAGDNDPTTWRFAYPLYDRKY